MFLRGYKMSTKKSQDVFRKNFSALAEAAERASGGLSGRAAGKPPCLTSSASRRLEGLCRGRGWFEVCAGPLLMDAAKKGDRTAYEGES